MNDVQPLPSPIREPLPVEAVPVYGGHRARFRKATGGWDWVCENGEPQIYASSDAALLAAWAARDRHTRGAGILSMGEKAAIRIEAEKLFLGGGKVVEVVRK